MKHLIQEEKDPSTDTIDMILEAHLDFSELREKIDTLISRWGEDDENEGKKDAVSAIEQAANLTKDEFRKYLSDMFEVESEEQVEGDNPEETAGLKQSYKFLQRISDHCLGDLIKDNSPIIAQCRAITTMSDEEIETHAGQFFKDKTNSHLREKYEQFYKKPNLAAAANDDEPSPSLIQSTASSMNMSDVNVTSKFTNPSI